MPLPAAPPTRFDRLRICGPELAAAAVAFLLVTAGLDPTGTYSWLPDGPGLTIDESFNVQQGVRLEVGSRHLLLGVLSPRQLFGATPAETGPDPPLGYHLADHPPLGRYLLGVAHDLVTAVAPPADWDSPFVTAAARFGSAAAFAATVFLVARFTTKRYGRPAGLTAAASLALMPRVFGHAHLASLETPIGLFFTATALYVADRWSPPDAVSNRAAALAGVLWGLALLTKVQAVLLPIPVALWALGYWRTAAVRPLAVFGLVGAAVFFVGWPWLWFDPVGHVAQYLGRTTGRLSLPVWYLGRVWADREAPWHYPFVMFAVTVPIGLHALALLGLFGGKGLSSPAVRLLAACLVLPLLVFAVPGVAVYDGERLFLVSFPLWAVLAGRGGGIAWTRLRSRLSVVVATTMLSLFLACQSVGLWSVRPAYLSYYNALVGGLGGADALGFEPTYWGDPVTADLLAAAARAVPDGGTIAVSPVLHQFQLGDLLDQSPALRRRNVRLVEWGRPDAAGADLLLVFDRKASLSRELREQLAAASPIAAVRRQGVTLAAVYRTRDLP